MIRRGECVILYTNAGNRIPQGSILRLVLFNIFINCLEEFAGDVKMGEDQLMCSKKRLPFRELDRLEAWQEGT